VRPSCLFLREQPFGRNILNSLFVAFSTVILSLVLAVAAAYALGRIRFRGRMLLLLTILGVSMFPQIAVLSGMFEIIQRLGLYNRLLGLDGSNVNVRGGAISLGHPIGASGCRVLVTLLYAMKDLGKHRGLASLCIGGGEALALVVER
jgi:ABC-type spermidine/putrescine transport system permease subunit II